MAEQKKAKFESIDVEKLNIVDKQGNIKMTLFNNDNIPPTLMDGEDILPGHRQDDPISGIMFYNNDGDECGGLIFGNEHREDGSYFTGASLTLDQYKQDQIVQMHYTDDNGERYYGFSIYDRPETPITELIKEGQRIELESLDKDEKQAALDKLYEGNTSRAFMGKNQKGEVSVRLMDSKGNQRIRMVVDETDTPRMEFLDGEGNVIYKLPPE